MSKVLWIRPFIVLAMVMMTVTTISACTSHSRTSETTGQYVDDATITSKVKAAILGEPGLSVVDIGVETYKGVVQLSGFVNTAQAKAHAGEIAANVSGVKSVRNNLVVK